MIVLLRVQHLPVLRAMKVVIFAFGCGAAGLAGGMYAYYFQYISPEQFNVAQSATILTMVVLGGIGTVGDR